MNSGGGDRGYRGNGMAPEGLCHSAHSGTIGLPPQRLLILTRGACVGWHPTSISPPLFDPPGLAWREQLALGFGLGEFVAPATLNPRWRSTGPKAAPGGLRGQDGMALEADGS